MELQELVPERLARTTRDRLNPGRLTKRTQRGIAIVGLRRPALAIHPGAINPVVAGQFP